MNTTTYVRAPRNKKHPFTRISNSIAKLPAVEAGIMLQILSNSDDWVINKEIVRKRSGLGEDRFKSSWNNLQELGYITLKKLSRGNGKFFYHYVIYENPETQNSTAEIESPNDVNRSTETHTTVNHITVTGGTNNYQEINEDQETICSSGSDGLSTKVEVRPGKNNTGSYILDQENIIEEDFQIVPHPPLCFGGVRDNEEDQKVEPQSMSSQPASNSNSDVDTTSGIKLEDRKNPISSESWYSSNNNLSTEQIEIIEDLKNVDDDLLIEIIQGYYEEELPQWEANLRQQKLHEFFKDVSKFQVPRPLEIEFVTEYYNRIKKENYK